MCRAVPLSSSVFHTACTLSAPTGHLPLEGKADDTRETCDQETFGHRHYLYSAALLIFMRRTTPVEPSEPIEPIEPAEPLSLAIKGRVAPGLTLKFESRDD